MSQKFPLAIFFAIRIFQYFYRMKCNQKPTNHKSAASTTHQNFINIRGVVLERAKGS